jgi:hypothetical protein
MTIYDVVKDLLTKYPQLRDNDKRLIWAVWYKQGLIHENRIVRETFYAEAEHPESITRARRQVQNDFPELRASQAVQDMRKEKQESKGTFVYRKQVTVDSTVDGSSLFNSPPERIREMRKQLEERGVLRRKT